MPAQLPRRNFSQILTIMVFDGLIRKWSLVDEIPKRILTSWNWMPIAIHTFLILCSVLSILLNLEGNIICQKSLFIIRKMYLINAMSFYFHLGRVLTPVNFLESLLTVIIIGKVPNPSWPQIGNKIKILEEMVVGKHLILFFPLSAPCNIICKFEGN